MNMKWIQARCSALFLLFILCSAPAWPQASTSSVRGTVRDQSNAVIPRADVILTNTATSVTLKTITNNAGLYLFPGVVPGPYRLTVRFAGMQDFDATLTVQVQTDAAVDPVLGIGQTSTQVSVQDVTPLVTTDVPTLGQVLDRERIDQLPINGRDVMTLLATIPGMESVSTGQSASTRAFGLRSGSAEYVVDGAAINERVWGGIERRPPGLDTIQEFKVEENNSSAKFTRPTTIIMSTKGGTNQLHGALFETNRNSGYGVARQRTDYYDKPPQLNRNEFGASAGGPVYIPKLYNGKNKTFWFFGYEAYRNINPYTMGFQVPTDAMRQGDYSGLVDDTGTLTKIYDPNTTTATWSREQFNYGGKANVIDPNRISPLAKYLYSITPEPTLPDVNPLLANNWYGTVPNNGRNWTISSRIDHRFSDRDQVYGRVSKGNFSIFQQFGSQPMLNGVAGTHQQTAPSINGAVSYVHTFSPTLFNELTLSASHELWTLSTGADTNWDAKLGLPNPFGVNGWPGIYATGLNSYYFETENTNRTGLSFFILDDNVTKVRGRHELQFGFHGRKDFLNTLPDQQQPQGATYFGYGNGTSLYDPTSGVDNPQATPYTGSALANMYLGSAQYTANMVRGYYYLRASEFALYFQDNFKVNSRLTINLGMRWEARPALREKNNSLVGYDPANNAVVLGTDLETMYKLGLTTPVVTNAVQGLGVKFESYKDAGLPRSLMYGNYKDFAPRIGFAYRGGDGARPFVLRGGYHISYFPVPLRPWIARMRMNTPQNASFYNIPDDPTQAPDGIPNYSMRSAQTMIAGQNSTNAISAANFAGFVPGDPMVTYFDPHQAEPMVQDWNLTLEKEVLPKTVVRVSYLGNHSDNLEQFFYTNDQTPAYIWYATQGTSLPGGTYASVARRPLYLSSGNATYGTMNQYMRSGWSNNQGGQVTVERRFNDGYAFQFFYTLTNSLTAGGQGYSGSSAIVNNTNMYLPGTVPADYDARNKSLNYQRDISIPKHRVQWNFIADLPFGKGKHFGRNSGKVLDRVIGGWQIAGLGSLRSTYFTLPTDIYPNGNKVEIYGYKYPIQDCRSGACIPGYLWWNGYINPNLINKPNGIMGVPADYKPAGQPLNAWPLNPDPSDPMYAYYGSNTVWVTLKDGTSQRTTYNNNLNPWRNQYLPSILQWNMDASLFKVLPIRENVRLRLNADFFNVFNNPGNPNSISGEGILSTQSSGQAARVMQLTLRLIW